MEKKKYKHKVIDNLVAYQQNNGDYVLSNGDHIHRVDVIEKGNDWEEIIKGLYHEGLYHVVVLGNNGYYHVTTTAEDNLPNGFTYLNRLHAEDKARRLNIKIKERKSKLKVISIQDFTNAYAECAPLYSPLYTILLRKLEDISLDNEALLKF